MNFEAIDIEKKLLDKHGLLPKHTLKFLSENVLLEQTYNSNAIAGNTLTLFRTKAALEGITAGGKPTREHFGCYQN